MKESRKRVALGLRLPVGIALALFSTAVLLALVLAAPTATNFGVDDASGVTGTNVLVPVNITNAQNGPIAGIAFDIFYDNSVITVVGIQAGTLTGDWDWVFSGYTNYPWGAAVALVYNGTGTELANGSTSSVVMLNVNVVGAPGTTSPMNIATIQLSDLDGAVGTASAENGTFTVMPTPNCSIAVDKKVWNTTAGAWEEEITAYINDTVRFRCVVSNAGSLDLTNITVTDFLSDSLEYTDNATVNGVPQEPAMIGPGEFAWDFTGPLASGENITIEFDATAVESGVDVNWQNATGYCAGTGTWVSDNDSASVTVEALPPEDFCLSVNDTSADSGATNVIVPVDIINAQNGPIAGIAFDLLYNGSALNVVGIQAGALTGDWDWVFSGFTNYPWGTAVALVYNGSGTELANGSTGSVVMFNVNVVGAAGTTSPMNLTNIQLSDSDGNLGTAPAKNGTFTVTSKLNCSIAVDKHVWNVTAGAWQEELTAEINTTVRFRCVVSNDGSLDLTNITVTDILSDSLEYANNATVDGVPQEPVPMGPGEFAWNFTGPLAPGENITIEFDATAVKTGVDVNWQNATGYCADTGTWVSDNDSASVTVTLPVLEFCLSVDDASGDSGTNVLVPVDIINAQNGPIAGIVFDLLYNDSVLNVVGIEAGALTGDWDWVFSGYTNYPGGTAVALVYNGSGTELANGFTGSVVLFNFSVVGAAGTTSRMNLTNIQLSDPDGTVGTAPAKNGTFTVLEVSFNVTITSPENRTYASQCVKLNFTVEPEGTALDWIGYSLDGGANVTITGNITIGGLSAGNHTIVVYANDTEGTMVASNTVFFTLHPADINFDGWVWVADNLLFAQAYNSKPGDPNWNPDADFNCDDWVYVADNLILAQNYNTVY